MKITVDFNTYINKYILKCDYASIQFSVPMIEAGDTSLSVEFDEAILARLMNLCIQELQDIKRQKVIKEEADRDKVKFIGVD